MSNDLFIFNVWNYGFLVMVTENRQDRLSDLFENSVSTTNWVIALMIRSLYICNISGFSVSYDLSASYRERFSKEVCW